MKKLSLTLMTLLLTSCGFEIVDPGYRGIKTNLGQVIGEPLSEGLHFYNPFTSDIKEFNVRQETLSNKTSIFTKDTQRVDVEYAITYAADPKFVNKIFLEYGSEDQLIEKIIKPVVLGSLKDAIGQVIADELVSKREIVTKAALSEVSKNLLSKSVIVTDLQFTNLDFDDAYEQAVEEKVVATQKAQKAKNETVTIEEEAKQTIATAKAEAESMRIKSQALAQNKGLVSFEIAKKWDGRLPVYMMGNSIPMLNLKNIGE